MQLRVSICPFGQGAQAQYLRYHRKDKWNVCASEMENLLFLILLTILSLNSISGVESQKENELSRQAKSLDLLRNDKVRPKYEDLFIDLK